MKSISFILRNPLKLSSFIFSRKLEAKMGGEELTGIENAKQKAAFQAVSDHVKGDMVLGIGSGSTIVYAVEKIVEIAKVKNFKLTCIPTSYQAQMLIVNNNLHLGNLDQFPVLDCVIDGADEIDLGYTLIKGGGACQTQEKIVAFNAKKVVIIADYTKESKQLGEMYKKGIPIEVIPFARVPVESKIISMFGGTTSLRMAKMKAGPLISDNGNFVVDWQFPANILDWESVNREIKMIPGVVETGLFVNMADFIYIGQKDGSVKRLK